MSPEHELTELLHALFCTKNHTRDMAEINSAEFCTWYLEEQTSECWQRRDHVRELERLEGFLEFFKLEKPERALEKLKAILTHVRALSEVVGENTKLYGLISLLTRDPSTYCQDLDCFLSGEPSHSSP